MKKLKPDKDREKERMNFVVFWAKEVRELPDAEWSRQQNVLINSQMQSAREMKLTKEEYLKIKEKRL